jgi:hypothetical protein
MAKYASKTQVSQAKSKAEIGMKAEMPLLAATAGRGK